MADIECEHCGGTDFYKEAGFFFCKGCQIQSQEVQEYAFEEFGAENRAKSKKVASKPKDAPDNKITSWECYNYVLLGLTQELINLGANKKLKSVVKLLWLCYLQKMGVFKLGQDQMPQLQAVCSGVDGEIVYGKLAKTKRKRRKSSSSDATSPESSSKTHERIKRKRALIKAQYEEFSQKSQGTSSLHNETLTSLQTGSEKSSKNSVSIKYNVYAVKELKRIEKSKYHWRRHRKDFQHTLKCHKLSYRKVSHKYKSGPYILSLNKLYSILYLGLLIIKDKIQLSDILRFIKEGKLSFNCYDHFFPDDFTEKKLNFRNYKKNSIFANAPFRALTSEMSIFLQVQYYISCSDLLELSDRYCKELNLPQEISNCVKNILVITDVKMSFSKRSNKVPNYEGRVLSIILFVIKLLFGLDDITEFHLSTYADILNKRKILTKMFSVIHWLKYIEYRDHVMAHKHFPTSFYKGHDVTNVDLVRGHLSKVHYPEDFKINPTKDSAKHLLTKLIKESDDPPEVEFPVTFTPFLDYINVQPNIDYVNILSKNFSNDSLDHILKPRQFLEIFKNCEFVHGGANDNWVVEELTCHKQQAKRNLMEKRKLVTVKLNFGSTTESNISEKECVNNGGFMKTSFHEANEKKFEVDFLRMQKLEPIPDLDLDEINNFENYPKHYNPHERFWMRTKVRLEDLNRKECKKFLDKFPYNFQLVFKECQRIAQQSQHELLMEYQMTEMHLVYLANFGKKTRRQEIIIDRLLAKCLNKNVDLW